MYTIKEEYIVEEFEERTNLKLSQVKKQIDKFFKKYLPIYGLDNWDINVYLLDKDTLLEIYDNGDGEGNDNTGFPIAFTSYDWTCYRADIYIDVETYRNKFTFCDLNFILAHELAHILLPSNLGLSFLNSLNLPPDIFESLSYTINKSIEQIVEVYCDAVARLIKKVDVDLGNNKSKGEKNE